MTAKIEATFDNIKLSDIVSNTAQSRGLGALPVLQAMGHGLFEALPEHDDKLVIWPSFFSDDPAVRKTVCSLIMQNEGHIIDKAESLESAAGQLQNIVVADAGDGKHDVVAGMLRCIAAAFNLASDPTKAPDTIYAKLLGKVPAKDLVFISLDENSNRVGESPIDKAMTYKRIETDFKIKSDEIGKRIGKSGQHVRDHVRLLDPVMSDKIMDIHTGKLSVDKALKMRKARKDKTGGTGTAQTTDSKNRARMPSVKKLAEAYVAKKKPKWMDQVKWELFIKEDVRRWLAKELKLKYKEFTGEVMTEEEEPEEVSKPAARAGFKYTITRGTAVKLLVALGKENAEKWEDSTIASKLEGIVNLVEDGQVLEDVKLQAIVTKLMANYSKGLNITVKPKPEAAAA